MIHYEARFTWLEIVLGLVRHLANNSILFRFALFFPFIVQSMTSLQHMSLDILVDRFILVKESIHSKIYNFQKKKVNPYFHYGPLCGGMT